MKQSLAVVCMASWAVACSSDATPPACPGASNCGIAAGSGGSNSGGSTSAGGAAPGAGASGAGAPSAPSAGSVGTAGTSGSSGSGFGGSSGTNAGGGGSAGSAAAGSAGTSGNGGVTGTAFECPAGPFAAPALSGAMATRIPGAPPSDDYNPKANGNVEGPVWIGESLYFSEMKSGNIPASRILKIAPGNVVSVAVADSGSNGLAVDGSGNLIAAVHKDGSLSQVALPGGAETPIVNMFGQPPTRFNSPNDLAIRSDGTIYFSDPVYQNNTNPQHAERLYRVTPGPTRTVSVATAQNDNIGTPNGVTLSPDEHTLYVSGTRLKKFTVMADGTLGPSSDFVVGGSGDGMVVDCSGNLYVTGGSNIVKVFSAAGAPLGTIMTQGGTTTNVAFGGADHKTLYITAMGSVGQRGVSSITLNVPGYPY